MATRRNLLKLFRRYSEMLVNCPQCPFSEPMSLDHFHTQHVYDTHGLNKTDCPFCFGNFKWESKCLSSPSTVQHQRECLRSFRTHYKYDPPPPPPEPLEDIPFLDCDVSFDVCEPCKQFDAQSLKLCMFEREVVPEWQALGFYDPHPLSKPQWWQDDRAIPLSDESGLGQDTAVVFQRFHEFKWYHICLKPFTFPLLEQQLKPIRGHVAVLPYQCLCDGLRTVYGNQPDYKHHRHMILAVRKPYAKRFRKIWARRMFHPKYKHTKGKLLIEIKDAHHLAAVIHYVGQNQASCDGKRLNTLNVRSGYAHYWMFRPIYPHGVLGMCTLYAGGLKEFLTFRYRPNNILPWKDVVEWNEKRQYTVPIWALKSNIRCCVVPVRRDLQPFGTLDDTDTTTYKIWLYESDQCLFFQVQPELCSLSRDEWYANQKNSGNSLFEAVYHERHVLTPRQQKLMAQIDKLNLDMLLQLERVHGKRLRAELKEANRRLEMADLKYKNWELTRAMDATNEGLKEIDQLLFGDEGA